MQSRSKRKRLRWSGVEVPDRAAEEGDEPPALARHLVHVEVEVSHHGVDEQPWVVVGQGGGGCPQGAVTDVEGDVATKSPRRLHGIEQDA